jgi:hypothetical protein
MPTGGLVDLLLFTLLFKILKIKKGVVNKRYFDVNPAVAGIKSSSRATGIAQYFRAQERAAYCFLPFFLII